MLKLFMEGGSVLINHEKWKRWEGGGMGSSRKRKKNPYRSLRYNFFILEISTPETI